jgi:hypothetical protein
MSGVAFSSVNQCFRQPDLKRMFETNPPITCPHAPDVLVCVDPCAGGEHSVCTFGSCCLYLCARRVLVHGVTSLLYTSVSIRLSCRTLPSSP